MHRVGVNRQPEPLLTPAEMGEADARAAAMGLSPVTLLRAASAAVAREVRRMGAQRVLVLCGPGGNGGDGWGAARLLAQLGWPVAVAEWAAPDAASAAGVLRGEWRGPVVPFAVAEVRRADVVIDAVFGAGLRDDVPEGVAAVLAAAALVVAVDVPSGLDGATGQPRGQVRGAEVTVAFAAGKPGHVLLPGRVLCGRVVVADIGLPVAALPKVLAWRNTPALWDLPRVGAGSHKYTRGHVTVLGGAAMTGAARLAAGAARRGGAGLATIAALGAGDAYRGGEPGTIVDDAPLEALLRDERRRVWVCGPGLGREAAGVALGALLAAGRVVVADADALAGAPEGLRGCAVLTPHAGEFARVFGPVGPDKVAAVRRAARLVGGVVVLKGADTVIAGPDGRVAINDNAPAFLATAGAGDVLAGLIAGLLAAGMPAWEAACAGVWLHGAAAARAGAGMVVEDLLAALGATVAG